MFDVQLANIFSHSVGGLFSLETISFVVWKPFVYPFSQLCAAGVPLRKSLPIPIVSRVFAALS
jgi:hypothetical protein